MSAADKFNEFSGKVKEGVGKLADDSKLQTEGKADQVKSKVEGAVNDAKEKVEGTVQGLKDSFSKND